MKKITNECSTKRMSGDVVDYYILKDGVLKKIENLESKILLKHLAWMVLGLVLGYLFLTYL